MSKINTPSYASLIPRDRRIRAIQELCNKLNEVESSGANSEQITSLQELTTSLQEQIDSINNKVTTKTVTFDGKVIFLDNDVYTTILGIDSITSDSTLEFSLSHSVPSSEISHLYEGSFNTASDITTSGQRLTVKWPSNINWGSSDLSLSPSTHYEFSIRDDYGSYYGLIHSWPLA